MRPQPLWQMCSTALEAKKVPVAVFASQSARRSSFWWYLGQALLLSCPLHPLVHLWLISFAPKSHVQPTGTAAHHTSHPEPPLQGGCAVLAGVVVAAGGLSDEVAAFWQGHRAALQQLLGPADSRRLAPMFQQVVFQQASTQTACCLLGWLVRSCAACCTGNPIQTAVHR